MKKSLITVIAVLAVISLLCTGALAQGNGSGSGGGQAGGTQPSGSQQPSGKKPPSENKAPVAEKLQNSGDQQMIQNGEKYGEPMNYTYSYNYGKEYGRFLDVTAVAEAIAILSDAEAAANLAALLSAYETAVNNKDPKTTQNALQALLDAIAAAELEVDSYTGLQLNKTSQGLYLDTGAVTEAILALDDPDTAAALQKLLDAYAAAVAGGDAQAAQDAFAALMEALAAAGVQARP